MRDGEKGGEEQERRRKKYRGGGDMKIRGGEMEKTFFPLTRLFETKKKKKQEKK